MKVKVIFFASLRDAVGTGTETVELAGDAASVAQVREALIAKGEVWAHALPVMMQSSKRAMKSPSSRR